MVRQRVTCCVHRAMLNYVYQVRILVDAQVVLGSIPSEVTVLFNLIPLGGCNIKFLESHSGIQNTVNSSESIIVTTLEGRASLVRDARQKCIEDKCYLGAPTLVLSAFLTRTSTLC
jgi:hypothetical protein